MRTRFIPQLVAALALCGAATGVSAQIAVIVNPKAGIDAMTAEQVSALFLGRTATLPNGGTARLADQAEGGAVHEAFYGKVTGRTVQQVKSTWSRLTFSGKATPPTVMAGSAEVRRFVASQADAIGYVEKSAVDGSVKVVLTVD